MKRALSPLFLAGASGAVHLLRHADPRRLDLARELSPPSWQHPLGCGEGGVDLLALLADALLRALLLAVAVAGGALVVGVTLGTAAGLAGGRAALAVRRACDFVQALPSFVLALGLLASLPHAGRTDVGVVLSLSAWAPFARLALAELRVVRGLAYVEASRALGGSWAHVLVHHAIGAALPSARTQFGSTASALLVADAALSFLGLGPSDGVTLGALVDSGVGSMLRAPHVLFVGAFGLVISALALQALADPRVRPTRAPVR